MLGELGQGHLDHADGAGDDLAPRGDDGLGLLPAQHRLRDLGRVRQVGEPGVVDHHARGREPGAQVLAEGSGDLVGVAAQGDLRGEGVDVLALVVVVRRGDVPQRRLGLRRHVRLVVVDVEDGLCGVLHPPHHHRRDLDGVAPTVVDLQLVAEQGACPQRHLEAAARALLAGLRPLRRRSTPRCRAAFPPWRCCRRDWPSGTRPAGPCRGRCRTARARATRWAAG